MKTFTQKVPTVQAAQYQGFGHGFELVRSLPDAVVVSEFGECRGNGGPSSLVITAAIPDSDELWGQLGPQHDYTLHPTDWIVRTPGTMRVLSDAEFREQYETRNLLEAYSCATPIPEAGHAQGDEHLVHVRFDSDHLCVAMPTGMDRVEAWKAIEAVAHNSKELLKGVSRE